MAASDPTVDASRNLKRPVPDDDDDDDDDDGVCACVKLLKQKGSCQGIVCKQSHFVNPFGFGLWQVNSIKIHRNMEHPNAKSEKVSIHGAVRLLNGGRWADYVFKQSKEHPIEFEKPDQTLALPLKGPSLQWVFMDGIGPAFTAVLILKYNNASIFGQLSPHLTSTRTSTVLEGSHDEVTIAYGGDSVGCANLFDEDCSELGYETWSVSRAHGDIKVRRWVYGDDVIAPEVDSVELEMESVMDGVLGAVDFTAIRQLMLHGKITARSCVHDRGIVLFERNKNEAVTLNSTLSIPLSRNMTIVDSRTSLIIEAHLEDVNDSNFLVNETILFSVGRPDTISTGTMAKGVINVKVEWKLPSYDVPIGNDVPYAPPVV